MLDSINVAANIVIWAGTIWAVLTHRVPTRCGGSVVLALIATAAMSNISASGQVCQRGSEVLMNVAIAIGICWAFWRLELKGRCR